jgi:hypothetical protein
MKKEQEAKAAKLDKNSKKEKAVVGFNRSETPSIVFLTLFSSPHLDPNGSTCRARE